MHAENFLINHSCHGKAIEYITEYAPQSDRKATLALIIKAVDSVDLGTLVIASEQEKVLWVLDFVA